MGMFSQFMNKLKRKRQLVFLGLMVLTFNFNTYTQEGYEVVLQGKYETDELTTEIGRRPTAAYQAYTNAAENKKFLILNLDIEKESHEAPNLIKEGVYLQVESEKINPSGLIKENGVYESYYTGLSIYSGKINRMIVFEVDEKIRDFTLVFINKEIQIEGTPEKFKKVQKKAEVKVTNIEFHDNIEFEKSSIYTDGTTKFRMESHNGKFLILTLSASFNEDNASIDINEFALISLDKSLIPPIGQMKDEEFRDILDGGSIRLRGGYSVMVTLVFSVGDLTENKLKSDYSLICNGVAFDF